MPQPQSSRPPIDERLAGIRLLVFDVDGVLTDGSVLYDRSGGELRRFDVHDGLGIVAVRTAGVAVAWLSGREHAAVERRAAELGVDFLIQGAADKASALSRLIQRAGVVEAEVAYVADDWNDIPAMRIAGVRFAVADAAEEVRQMADYVSAAPGGRGAARDICMRILAARGPIEGAQEAYLNLLKSSDGQAQQ